MSIKKTARPLVKVKTVSSTLASTSPTLSQTSTYPDTKFDDSKSDGFEDGKSVTEMTDYAPSRPLSVAVPRRSGFTSSGPYCARRPALSDILANNSPQPWTLSAFMAYLSQNHCLETLEFTMDASRYRKHYNKLAARSPGGRLSAGLSDTIYMQSLWQRLLDAYIVPNGLREVNIPSDVRDSLINYPTRDLPPEPSVLDIAVQKVYELMEDSVLVPFLNSAYPVAIGTDVPDNTSQDDLSYTSRSYDDRAMYRRSGRKERPSPPPGSASTTSLTTQHRSSAPSSTFQHFARNISSKHNSTSSRMSHLPSARTSQSQVMSPTNSNQSEYGYLSPGEFPVGLMDDTAVSSPSAVGEPMTPPNTPPQSDYVSPHSAGKREGSGTWKKMRSSFTFKKKSGSLREEETGSHGHFV